MKNAGLNRRDFLKLGVAGAAGAALGRVPLAAAAETAAGAKPKVWVIKGADNGRLMTAALKVIGENGGFGEKAKTLALKVNAGWERTPEQGANTDPVLVETFLLGVKKLGIASVTIPENPCAPAVKAFGVSGLQAAADKGGAKMVALNGKYKGYREVTIPGGQSLTKALVAGEYLDADVIVNIPVCKHHGGGQMSCAMKNWMGVVKDRGFWHKNNLHQCIADFCLFIKPRWTIIDATRCMLDSGPQGPAKKLIRPQQLIVSQDQVAADAVASKFFKKTPSEILYLANAARMKLGVIDEAQMEIINLDA